MRIDLYARVWHCQLNVKNYACVQYNRRTIDRFVRSGTPVFSPPAHCQLASSGRFPSAIFHEVDNARLRQNWAIGHNFYMIPLWHPPLLPAPGVPPEMEPLGSAPPIGSLALGTPKPSPYRGGTRTQ